MTVQIVGSGLGRTGTMSLKLALERLLEGPCYHMMEVGKHPDHVSRWHAAARDGTADWTRTDWDEMFDGYAAVVDWPVAPFWASISAAYPDAPILHSTRSDAATWFKSASATIFQRLDNRALDEFYEMWEALAAMTFDGSYEDADVAMAGYERHNATVEATADSARLVRYQPGDGWAPLCSALGMEVPDEPFPHVNSTEEFQSRRSKPKP